MTHIFTCKFLFWVHLNRFYLFQFLFQLQFKRLLLQDVIPQFVIFCPSLWGKKNFTPDNINALVFERKDSVSVFHSVTKF